MVSSPDVKQRTGPDDPLIAINSFSSHVYESKLTTQTCASDGYLSSVFMQETRRRCFVSFNTLDNSSAFTAIGGYTSISNSMLLFRSGCVREDYSQMHFGASLHVEFRLSQLVLPSLPCRRFRPPPTAEVRDAPSRTREEKITKLLTFGNSSEKRALTPDAAARVPCGR